MKFGVQTGNLGSFGSDPGVRGCIALAEAAERFAFDSVWVNDHVAMPAAVDSRYPYNDSGVLGLADMVFHEPLTVLSAIAARTSRVLIGTSVLIVPMREPLLMANMLATIDQISSGRLILGIGVGWLAEEFEALGMGRFFARRGSVTDEWIEVLRRLWTAEAPVGWNGRFISFEPVTAYPRPYQESMPVWVGGKTDVAIRRAARYGDGYHSIASSPADLAAEVGRLHEEMAKQDRDSSRVTVSMSGRVTATSRDELIDVLGRYDEAGLDHLLGVPAWFEATPAAMGQARLEAQIEHLQRFAEDVRPHIA